MNTLKKDLYNLAFNSILTAILYFGAYKGNQVCWNIIQFLYIALGILSIFCFFGIYKIGINKLIENTQVPSKFVYINSHLFFLINLVLCVGSGHFVVGTSIFISWLYWVVSTESTIKKSKIVHEKTI